MIRLARKEDIPALREIYNEEIRHYTATFDDVEKSLSDREAWFQEHTGKYILLVYEEGSEVLGYASLSCYRPRGAFSRTAEISLYVNRNYLHQGIGTALMEEILSRAKREGNFDEILSLITSSNIPSIRLHEKFGFTLVGKLKNVGVKFGEKLSIDVYQFSL